MHRTQVFVGQRIASLLAADRGEAAVDSCVAGQTGKRLIKKSADLASIRVCSFAWKMF